MKCIVVVVLIGAFIGSCQAQRIPPLPQNFQNNPNNPNQPQPPPQNVSGGPSSIPNMLLFQQQQKTDELANVKDESIKRILLELSTLQTPSQMSETMVRVAALVGPLFVANYEARKDQITGQSRDPTTFPQRLLSAVTDIQGEEVKALVLQKQLESLHASDFAFLPLAIQYGLQDDVLRNLSGTKLASVVKSNPGDTVVATKVSMALMDQPEQQIEFLQSLGTKLIPGVQRIIMSNLLNWWGDPHTWKDRELNMLISAGNPLLAYMPQSELQSLDDELADRFVTTLGQTQDIARGWWRKPMSVKKAWFDVAKGARYFGTVSEWSFRRMQKLSFLLEGATPEDLELIPDFPEIKGLVIGNHYTELQARVVFDAFYQAPPLSQEDLQEFQFHALDLIPTQLQRFDFADSFGTLDEMLSILERQPEPSYPTVLQISYFMWPIINTTNSVMNIAPPSTWQKRELSQIGKMFFLLPKSVLFQIKSDLINWDSNILGAIRSNHLSQFQIWRLTSKILPSVDERLKPDYIFMIPSPFQKGIPTQNITQALLGTTTIRPEVLRALIEETSGMLISQKTVILQRIQSRMAESIIIRMMISSSNPSEIFDLISPKILSKNMPNIIKTITEMPEMGRFGLTSIQTKLLPKILLSLWLKWVRESSQVARWTAEDLLGRSSIGGTNELNFAILGLSCRDIDIIDPWDVLSVIMHYRHELYALRRFEPSLTFNANLRSCVIQKLVTYLKQKHFLDQDKTDGHVLAGISDGEIDAIGGEIFSIIPQLVLDQLNMITRKNVIKEIGRLQMTELFSLVPLENLHWYGTTLFKDIEISGTQGTVEPTLRRRRQTEPVGTDSQGNATTSETTAVPDNASGDAPTVRTTPADNNGTDPASRAVPADGVVSATTPTPVKRDVDSESLNSMGNLLCYADNLFDNIWPRTLLKDVLEAKTEAGEKTCCLSKLRREKWFETLKTVYGPDSSSWNEFDLTAIGDLLIVLPEEDLLKISTDSLGKATTPIQRQSAYATKITMPGQVKRVQFVTACVEALGNEGPEFMTAYKRLMRRNFQASQWMVNTVKTTQELIQDGVGRTGRIPRWAEHTLVKRQLPPSAPGGDVPYGGTGFSPAQQQGFAPAQQGQQAQTGSFAAAAAGTAQTPGQQQGSFAAATTGTAQGQQQSLQTRGLPNPGQQPVGASSSGQQQTTTPGQQPTGSMPGSGQQQQPKAGSVSGQQQQPKAGSVSGQQQQPQTGSLPGQQQAPSLPGQQTGGSVPGQQAGSGQQQTSPGQQKANPGQQQANSGQQTSPGQQQAGVVSGQQQQLQTRGIGAGGSSSGQQQATLISGQQPTGSMLGQQAVAGQQQTPPGNIPPQQVGMTGGIQQIQLTGAPQQQTQPLQPGATGNFPGTLGRGSGADLLNQQFGQGRERAVGFGGPLQDETHSSEITCHGVKAAGSAAIGLVFEDLDKLTQADLFDCVEALGRIEWDDETKSHIISLLKQKLEFSQDAISALTLIEMGDLVTAFSADTGPTTSTGFGSNSTSSNITIHSDVSMIDLTLPLSLDVLSILGQHVTDPALLKALAEKFNQDNRIFPGFSEGIARPENLRIVVMSLGNVICGLSDKIVNSIFETDGSLFIDTSRVLGRLEGCSNGVLSTLATHAVRPTNYGAPRLWSQEDVETVGVVFAGMKPDIISNIPADAMQGLTPLAVKNLPAPSIMALTSEQLEKMSYSAARAFTPNQINNLDPAQLQALQSVLQVQPELFNVAVIDEQAGDIQQDVVVRTIGNEDVDANGTDSIGGRSRDDKSIVPPVIADEIEPENTTTLAPDTNSTTDEPTSAASPSKLLTISSYSFYGSLLAIVISVMQFTQF